HDGAPNIYTSGGNILEDISSMENNAVDPELAAFINLYKQALDSGALSDPLVSSTVESSVTQIANIGEIVQHSIYEFKQGDVNTVSEFKDNQVSIATDMESSRTYPVSLL
ncbi:hypothetical protein EBZ38_17450, partial [bacterium]|nr:hypothetical protein [bacterium]